MSLIIQANSSHKADNLIPLLAEQITTFVLDIDDTLYHALTGLHTEIKQHIFKDANANPDLLHLRGQWASAGKISQDLTVKPTDLHWAFPLIVDHYRQQGFDKLTEYFDQVYQVDYSVIAPQPELVAAIDKLRANGRRVVIYTNGPWGAQGRTLHVNRVLHQIGFASDAFDENDIVDLLKIDRNPSLLRSFNWNAAEAVRLFNKVEEGGFVRMAKALGFKTDPHVAFLDDDANNLASTTNTGILRIHTPTNQAQIADAVAASKRDYAVWSAEKDASGRFLSLAGLLLQQVAAWLPEPTTTVVHRSDNTLRSSLIPRNA